MSNQTPHTPQTHQKMKPITIPPEMKDLVKKINKLASTVIPELEKSEEENRKRELEEQNQQNEFIEINGIKLETKNLGRPQNPKIKINQQLTSETIPLAWEEDGNWYYNWKGAKAEAKFLGKKIPTQKQWEQICKPFGDDGKRLSKELNLPTVGDRNLEGLIEDSGGSYWSSTSWGDGHISSLVFWDDGINYNCGRFPIRGFSVRCIAKETFNKNIFNKVALSKLKEDKKVKKNKRNPFII